MIPEESFSFTVYDSKKNVLLFSTVNTIDSHDAGGRELNQQLFYIGHTQEHIRGLIDFSISDYVTDKLLLVIRKYKNLFVVATAPSSVPAPSLHRRAHFLYRLFRFLVPPSAFSLPSHINPAQIFLRMQPALSEHIAAFAHLLDSNATYFINAQEPIRATEALVGRVRKALRKVLDLSGEAGRGSYGVLFVWTHLIAVTTPPGAQPLDVTDVQILLGYVHHLSEGSQLKSIESEPAAGAGPQSPAAREERSWSMFLTLGEPLQRPCKVLFKFLSGGITLAVVTPDAPPPDGKFRASLAKSHSSAALRDHARDVHIPMRSLEYCLKGEFGALMAMATQPPDITTLACNAPGVVFFVIANRSNGRAFAPAISGFPITPVVGDPRAGTRKPGTSANELVELETWLRADAWSLLHRPCETLREGFSAFAERGPLYTRTHELVVCRFSDNEIASFRPTELSSQRLRALGRDEALQPEVGTSEYYNRVARAVCGEGEHLFELFGLFLSCVSFADARRMLRNLAEIIGPQVGLLCVE
eukprot:gnl/Chilomastix_cuspidata/2536.p2 GENE.gnl/Chilomastix_cuspidata/2536~~gnl/Chilomastix_cuspidata/2536.p2  ORF type:complete len:530 (-),score=253.91 gnl/Chilomastix_cuspidata/2536:2322-3911(-)